MAGRARAARLASLLRRPGDFNQPQLKGSNGCAASRRPRQPQEASLPRRRVRHGADTSPPLQAQEARSPRQPGAMLRQLASRLAPQLLPSAAWGLEAAACAGMRAISSSAVAQGVGIPERRHPLGTHSYPGRFEGEPPSQPASHRFRKQ